MSSPFTILASDFHLTPANPREIEVFVAFTRDVVRGAERFLVLGDLFEYWVGPHQLDEPGYAPVFDAFRALASAGTEVVLFHGNRDFLLGAREAAAAGGRVVGEECVVDLHGRRVLAMHGDSLCTRDVDYQKSKRWLRSSAIRWLSRVMPKSPAHAIARKLRRSSKRNVARKDSFTMGIVDDEVARRLAEGAAVIVCGHVHRPEHRIVEVVATSAEGANAKASRELIVLGDWLDGGIFARADSDGVKLRRYGADGRVTDFPAGP